MVSPEFRCQASGQEIRHRDHHWLRQSGNEKQNLRFINDNKAFIVLVNAQSSTSENTIFIINKQCISDIEPLED